MKPIVIDFETMGILPRPSYPPEPVGVAIKWPGRKGKYYGWGHPTENNCTFDQAMDALWKAWSHKGGLLFHNAKFDLDAATTKLHLPMPNWHLIHDTVFLLYLFDPRMPDLSLKPCAERLLDWEPEEQDRVRDWLMDHQPIPGIKLSLSHKSPYYWAAYIALAPGNIVGPYAVGDVERTSALFDYTYGHCKHRQMNSAYDRERRLMLHLLDMERMGVPIDVARLQRNIDEYHDVLDRLDKWLRRKIKVGDDFNLNSGEQLVGALIKARLVDADLLERTASGKYSSANENLKKAQRNRQLHATLHYRSQLMTSLNTFMIPWYNTASVSGGKIYTRWNQTRSDMGGGTRTGRLSSQPNFQNAPKVFDAIWRHEKKGLPAAPFEIPPLPNVRSYIVPSTGCVLIDRDYSQQELRIMAHFDGGDILDKYHENPWIDFHDSTKEELELMGKHYERRPVKNTNFGLIFGMGVGAMARKNNITVDEATALKRAILSLYPGLKNMYAEMKRRAKTDLPIRTWGGREYYCEPPKLINGRTMEFDYKLVNILIQGSAADCTKEAMIRYCDARDSEWPLYLTVHDQLTGSAPHKQIDDAMECLRTAMESVEFDVVMLTEGKVSKTNWANLIQYDKHGRRVFYKW